MQHINFKAMQLCPYIDFQLGLSLKTLVLGPLLGLESMVLGPVHGLKSRILGPGLGNCLSLFYTSSKVGVFDFDL